MQVFRRRGIWILFALGLLLAALAAFLLARPSEHREAADSLAGKRSSGQHSFETSISAFAVPPRRHLPPFGQQSLRAAVENTFAGIGQHGVALGDPRAPVTMRFLADPECPEAREFAVRLLPLLVRRWVRDGELRIEYRGQRAETVTELLFRRQQMAVLAAGRQGKLWQYLGLFYRYQGPEYTRYADGRFLRGLAREVRGLDLASWARDRSTPELARRAMADATLERSQAIRYTPAFQIGPTGGRLEPLLHFTLTEPLAFEAAFEEALSG